MNRILRPALALALLALPLVADEPKTEPKKSDAPVTTAAAPAPATTDSPLVAASKRSRRLGKKPANVITNETLKSSGKNAHVTTTTNPAAPPLKMADPKPTPEMVDAANKAKQRAEAEKAAANLKKAEEQKQRRADRKARAIEEGTGDQEVPDADAEDYHGRPEDLKPEGPAPPPPAIR